jgi:hypothetical protein
MSEQFGRLLVILGVVLALSGLVIILVGRLINLNELPGTIKIESGNFRLVFPLGASILISIILTIILNVIVRLFRR